jgi:hypothetical protein
MCRVSDLNVGITIQNLGYCMAVLVDVFAPYWPFGVYEPGFGIHHVFFYETMKRNETIICIIIQHCLGVW